MIGLHGKSPQCVCTRPYSGSRDLGWNAQSIGTNLPLEMMAPAIEDLRPQLCWVSASYVESTARLREQLSKLGRVAALRGARVICGGRAIGEDLKREIVSVRFLTDLNQLNAMSQERR